MGCFGRMSSSTVPVRVTTPESTADLNVNRNLTIQQLLHEVCQQLGLHETWYFGLKQKTEKKTEEWLDSKSKLSSLKTGNGKINVSLEIRYYPGEISEELIEDRTQWIFYCEVKRQILANEISCAAENALLLASYQAVIENGSYNSATYKPGLLDIKKYLPSGILKQYKVDNSQWESKIVQWYQKHGNMCKEEAVMNYLKFAQELDTYGLVFVPIKNVKSTSLLLGIDALGVNVYPANDKRAPKVHVTYGEIQSVIAKGNKVTIKPTEAGVKEMSFTCDKLDDSKLVAAMITGNLEMYKRRRSPDTPEIIQMKARAKKAKELRIAEQKKLDEARRIEEERYRAMEQSLQEKDTALKQSKATVTEREKAIKVLEEELKNVKHLKDEIEQKQKMSEEANVQLTKELESVKKREQELLAKNAEIKGHSEDDSLRRKPTKPGDHETKSLPKPQEPQNITDSDLAAIRDEIERKSIWNNPNYDENPDRDRNRMKTLRILRTGNTKSTVEVFEAL
ncbi:unnamed protein product [Calicophoron daubneyi]|uniref:FERM domain-containing protein n=1 Tax=Calicophoron daubneyi TaxID=300641 RepID=A0AAV2TTQ8_CALDB